MKADFDKMTRAELKAYIRIHRNDMEAIRALFKRRGSSGRRYPAPRSEADIITQTEIIQRKLQGM